MRKRKIIKKRKKVHVVVAGREPCGGFGKTTWLQVTGKRLAKISGKRLGYRFQENDLVDGFGKKILLLVLGKRVGYRFQERDLVDGFGKKILLLVSAWKTETGSKVSEGPNCGSLQTHINNYNTECQSIIKTCSYLKVQIMYLQIRHESYSL